MLTDPSSQLKPHRRAELPTPTADVGQSKSHRQASAFSEQLGEWRRRHNLTQRAGAEFIGIPLRTFEDYEASRRTPDAFKQKALIKRLLQKKLAAP